MKKEVVFIVILSILASAMIISDSLPANFAAGTFSSTQFNASAPAVELNGSLTGAFTSQIFNAGILTNWTALSWIEGAPYGEDLPDSGASESALGGVDMSGNVFLSHADDLIGPAVDNSGNNRNAVIDVTVLRGQPGVFNSSYIFDSKDAALRVNASDLPNVSSAFSVEAWFMTTLAQTVRGHVGDSVISTLEFDPASGAGVNILLLTNNTYAVAYSGSDNDGFIATLKINQSGKIGVIIDSLEFDTIRGVTPEILFIGTDTYAVVYDGVDEGGFVKTINVSANGTIANSVIDSFEYDASSGREPDTLPIGDNAYLVAYRGASGDGFFKTLNISTNGTISKTVLDTLEFDTSNGRQPSLVHVAGDVYGVAYRGSGDDGFLATVMITSAGAIAGATIDTVEFDTSRGVTPSIVKMSPGVFALAYSGSGTVGILKIMNISNGGGIISTPLDNITYDATTGNDPHLLKIAPTLLAITYRGVLDDGFVKSYRIPQNGKMGLAIDSLEFDTENTFDPMLVSLGGDSYGVAYQGSASDGFLKSLSITSDRGVVLEKGLSIDTNQTHALAHHGAEILSAPTLSGWNHVVLTHDSENLSLYVNGKVTSSLTNSFSLPSADLVIGKEFNGSIDEVALFSKSLTAVEVLSHYKRGAVDLTISSRSCNDALCSGESFGQLLSNPGAITPSTNQYFQYQANFTARRLGDTPQLHNVSITNAAIDVVAPVITDLRPINASVVNTLDTILLTANVTDNLALDKVLGNLTYPNGTSIQFTMSAAGGAKYATLFSIPSLSGNYSFFVIANDTSGQRNVSEASVFNANFTVIHAVSITYAENKTASTLSNVTNVLRVVNRGTVVDNYTLAATNPQSASFLSLNVTALLNVQPGQQVDVDITVGSPTPGNFTSVVNITSGIASGVSNQTVLVTELINNPRILSSLIQPVAVILGEDVELFISALNAVSTAVQITGPTAIVDDIDLANNDNTTFEDAGLLGRYNITFRASDAANSTVSQTDYLEVFTGVDFRTALQNFNASSITASWAVLYRDQEINSNATTSGQLSQIIVNTSVSVLFNAYNDRLRVLFRDINSSTQSNKTLGLDKHTSSNGFLVTYGVNSNYSMSNATVTIVYDDTGFTSESGLQLHKCDDYNFISRKCTGSFVDITSQATQDQVRNLFNVTVTSFSAFAIKQGTSSSSSGSSGGGGSRSSVSGSSRVRTPSISFSGLKTPDGSSVTSGAASSSASTPKFLFDIGLELSDTEVSPGGRLDALINLVNFGDEGDVPIQLTYKVLNGAGTALLESTDSDIVSGQKELVKSVDVSSLPKGKYTLMVDLRYPGQTDPAIAERTFTVGDITLSSGKSIWWTALPILGLLLLAGLLGVYLLKKPRLRKHAPAGRFKVRGGGARQTHPVRDDYVSALRQRKKLRLQKDATRVRYEKIGASMPEALSGDYDADISKIESRIQAIKDQLRSVGK
jgi:hypothetical protein